MRPTDGSEDLIIRAYTPEDEAAWLDCWGRVQVTSHAWGLPGYQAKPRYKRPACELVAGSGGIVGFVDVEIEDQPGELGLLSESRCGFVWELGVAPGYRGRGLGRRLVAGAADWLRTRGIARMEFWSMDEEAQAFYERLGMREINRHWRFWLRPAKTWAEVLRADAGAVPPALTSLSAQVLHATCSEEDWPTVLRSLPVASDPPLEPHLCRGFDCRF